MRTLLWQQGSEQGSAVPPHVASNEYTNFSCFLQRRYILLSKSAFLLTDFRPLQDL